MLAAPDCVPQASTYFSCVVIILIIKIILIIPVVIRIVSTEKYAELIFQSRERNINPPAVLEPKSVDFIPVTTYTLGPPYWGYFGCERLP